MTIRKNGSHATTTSTYLLNTWLDDLTQRGIYKNICPGSASKTLLTDYIHTMIQKHSGIKKKKGEQVFSLDLSFKAHGKNVGEQRPAAGGESLGCLCLACTGPFQPLRLCDSVFSAHYLHRSYTQSWFRHIFKWKLSLNFQVASLQFSITFWLLTIKTEAFSIFFNLLWFPGLFATSLPTSSPVTKHRDRMHRVSSKSLVLPGQRHCNHRS